MLPKRKLIKKRYRKPEEQNSHQTQPTTLIQKLHSGDPNLVQQALVYLSSLCFVEDTPQLLGLIAQLVGILEKGSTSIVYQCLYALANLIDIESRLVPKLFQFGLAKSLTQLNSGDAQLLKPILTLMTSLRGYIPEEFLYLQKGFEQSLNTTHLQSASKEQVLTYLNRIESTNLGQDMYNKIFELFKNESKLQIRALCAGVLLRNPSIRLKIQQQLIQFCDQMMCDIDLEKEYKNNIVNAKPAEKIKEVQTELMEQEEEVASEYHPNLQIFSDAVEAVETTLESLLAILEEVEDVEEQDIQGQGDWENEKGMETQEEFSLNLMTFLKEKLIFLNRNTSLTFVQGQNIVHLSLRLLASLNLAEKENLVLTAMRSVQNTLKLNSPEELRQQILAMSLHILMDCPLPQSCRNMMIQLGQIGLKVSSGYKDCWIRLLQIFSKLFNPEKNKVSLDQNRRVGAILKNLIINIPEINLQEWRAQAIDTVFDIFSNQNFDQYFIQLGLMQLLQQVLSHVGGGKKTKFVRQVVTDIQRFLEYKRKMMHN